MGKVRHRKHTRAARVAATDAPLAHAQPASGEPTAPAQHREGKKGARRDHDMQTLLDQLRAPEGRDRVFAASTLSSLILSLPPLQLRLLLSRNLIGLLIERLAAVPHALPAAPTSPPPADDLSTAIESLGALRNLAVSSPPHIVSEMHNKRLLLPLTTIHLPLLSHFLVAQLAPPAPPVQPPLPASAEARRAADDANEASDTLRRSYWDWCENTLVLLWCLAESNTKILASLNAHADLIVRFCVALLDEDRLGIERFEGVNEGEDAGMRNGAEKGAKKKDQRKDKAKRGRVPLFVAVAAAQTLHAVLSSNPPAHSHLLSSASSHSFSPALASLLSILLSPSAPPAPPARSPTDPGAAHHLQDWAQLRVLAFGALLELAKGRSKRRDVEAVRDALRSDEAQEVLLALVRGAKLNEDAGEGAKVAQEIDPTALPTPHAAPTTPEGKLSALERGAQTLQLALEVLSEWLASGLPSSASFDAVSSGDGDEENEEEEEEEWGGISMQVEDDIDMGVSDGEGEGEDAAMGGDVISEADGVLRRKRGDTPERAMGDDEMLDDLAAAAGGDDDEDEEVAGADKDAAGLALLSSLPLQLLQLSRPTPLSFLPSSSFASSALDGPSSASTKIPTSASEQTQHPAALVPLAEALTTIHVRAIEALNNLYVTLSRAGSAARRDAKELQSVFEGAMLGMLEALEGAQAQSAPAPAPAAVAPASGKKGKGKQPAGDAGEDEVDEVQERRRESVMAGAGVVWGCVRLGLDQDKGSSLKRFVQVVGPDTTPFLIQRVYASPFAAAQTPAGEAIRVRTLGALGWLGRRKDVPADENAQIGRFLLSLLPTSRAAVLSTDGSSSSVASTPDILLQTIDSFIDLYADEEREYDAPVFRQGGMLPVLEASVAGVRATIKKVDRNKFPELRSRADGALENLVAFVQYRKDVEKQLAARRR
ncbi:hypothetical protein Rhopal_000583-T1 [Rhodotorula paludigena]|uniref:SYO1-like TPR repeats domain-containing protein n=1 Tax=Rhodotorula paludigena TaxID=86838 RepID=A0AAV5GC28_9BASI|nr:hypothetical protein Rhopal_000583-T1 [Rhodotorula paludigena]